MKSRVGITSYGAYIPNLVIQSDEIARAQQKDNAGLALGILQKTVPHIDEDTATLAVAAALQAKERSVHQDFYATHDGALFIGSESHPYAVKPTGTIVHQALNLSPSCALADLQFACKAGTQGLQACFAYVRSELAEFGLAIGADTAQSRPGDVLEYSAAAGGAAFFVGKDHCIAHLLATHSYVSDTPDFWRRPNQEHPEHAGRFSGEPAYFHHIKSATQALLKKENIDIQKIDHCVFHTPNGKFPKLMAHELGCSPQQLQHSLVVDRIGNTYAAASLLALVSVLDHAEKGEKILVTSYGSGAGADSFLFECSSELEVRRKKWKSFLHEQIEQCSAIPYEEYRKNTT